MLKDRVTEIPLDGGCADWVMPNADGTGYWRFDTGSDNLNALIDAYDGLSDGEQILLQMPWSPASAPDGSV